MSNNITKLKGEINMPYGDRTGPQGRGPRTGRGLGNCPPNSNQQNEGTDRGGYGQGFGRGFGRGRGFRRRFD